MNQVLLPTVYFAALSIAPSIINTWALIPIVLLARALLVYPYLAFRPKQISSTGTKKSGSEIPEKRKRQEEYGLSLGYKPTIVTIIVGYVSLQLLPVMQGSILAFLYPGDIIRIINNDSAVSTLGYDLLITMASLALWYSTQSRGTMHGN